MKPRLSIRPRADADIDDVVERYLLEAGEAVALRVLDAVQDAQAVIADNPGIGSPLLGQQLSMEGLRSWKISGFPYLLIYLRRDVSIDVVRLLHAHRDIPGEMAGDVD